MNEQAYEPKPIRRLSEHLINKIAAGEVRAGNPWIIDVWTTIGHS